MQSLNQTTVFWTLAGAMLSYTLINSHSQVSDPATEDHLVYR